MYTDDLLLKTFLIYCCNAGDTVLGGIKMKSRPGHFDEDRKPSGFNIKQVFVSPSIRYAGHDAYATPIK